MYIKTRRLLYIAVSYSSKHHVDLVTFDIMHEMFVALELLVANSSNTIAGSSL